MSDPLSASNSTSTLFTRAFMYLGFIVVLWFFHLFTVVKTILANLEVLLVNFPTHCSNICKESISEINLIEHSHGLANLLNHVGHQFQHFFQCFDCLFQFRLCYCGKTIYDRSYNFLHHDYCSRSYYECRHFEV